MPRATGGCQVSHSAGRQIFDAAYRFYWYIEYFLRPRERASMSSLYTAIDFSCACFATVTLLVSCGQSCESFINNILSRRVLRTDAYRITSSKSWETRYEWYWEMSKNFRDNYSLEDQKRVVGIVKIDGAYVTLKINSRLLRTGQQWPIFIVTWPHRSSCGLSPRKAIILNSGPAVSHGMSWRLPPSLSKKKKRRDMLKRWRW